MLLDLAGRIVEQVNEVPVVDLSDYSQVAGCEYRGERYSVRDNGAVFRHPRDGKRARVNDNRWTFGKENSSNPYLHISSVPVHRIVAIAFHGGPPDPKHVVDHIDSNCRNNRPENLRWLSRLENALKNPATRKKIQYLCGSIEAFLENPSILNDLRGDPNFKWMRTVTREEAHNCLVRMSLWARSTGTPTRSTNAAKGKSSFGERAYKPLQKWEVGFGREPGLELAQTPWCAQYMWHVAAYFPCCPRDFGADPIDDYFQNLEVGVVLAYGENDGFVLKLKVLEAVIHKPKSSILVMCERSDIRCSIVGIEHDVKSSHFIHFFLGDYACGGDADEAFRLKKDLDHFWSDGYTHSQDLI